MSFVTKIIGPDEKLIGISGAHWIYGATGLLWLGGMMGFGLFLDYYSTGFFEYLFKNNGAFAVDRIADALFWIPTALGGIMFLIYLMMMIAPEIALTSKRIIYKRGIVFTDIKEVDLEEIKAANVNNAWFGRFLNYGFVEFDARFVTGMDLPAIGKPYRFVKALNDARSHLKEDSMTVVLEGAGEAVQKEIAAQAQVLAEHHQPEKIHEVEVPEPTPKPEISPPPETPKPEITPPPIKAEPKKLSDPAYDDQMEASARRAVKAVMQEAKDSAKQAIVQPAENPADIAGPVVFNDAILLKEKELRHKIMDNFTDTVPKTA